MQPSGRCRFKYAAVGTVSVQVCSRRDGVGASMQPSGRCRCKYAASSDNGDGVSIRYDSGGDDDVDI
jgi:hypothetical protein